MIIKENDALKDYIAENVDVSWRYRDFVDSVKMYWNSSMGCIFCLSGLRGMGKTTGLLQSIIDIDDTIYICAQRIESRNIDSAKDILDILKNNKKKYIIIDEYTWISDREALDASLYTFVQDGFRIAITGTESMTLELLNYGKLSHRVFMCHCNYFSYDEHLRVNNLEHTKAVFDDYIQFGGLFEPHIIRNFKEMESYIRESILESLCAYMSGSIDIEQAKAIIYTILYRSICQLPAREENSTPLFKSTTISIERFYEMLQISPTVSYSNNEFATAVNILKKIEFITEVENIDEQNVDRSRIYIVNPSITCQLFYAIYDEHNVENFAGYIYEAICASRIRHTIRPDDKLFFLKGNSHLSKEQEIDFVIVDKNREPNNSKYAYLIECKHKGSIGLRTGASILSPEIQNYFPNAYDIGRYVLYTGAEDAFVYLDNTELIFISYISQHLEEFYDFDSQVSALKNKGSVYPKT